MPKGIFKRKPHTEETKRKIGEAQKGEHSYWFGKKRPSFSEKTLEKMRKNNKGEGNPMYGKRGILSPFYGKKRPEEVKRKISEALSGDKCYLWKGGSSFELYTLDWTKTLKRSIRERDDYTCKICGRYQSNLDKREFDVHHIDYNKKNCDPKNLITLCFNCHRKTNHNRDYWIKYFNN